VERVITRTGILTGEALGKSCASFSTQVCGELAGATTVASLNTDPVLFLSVPNQIFLGKRG
jgi:hypothetical protein